MDAFATRFHASSPFPHCFCHLVCPFQHDSTSQSNSDVPASHNQPLSFLFSTSLLFHPAFFPFCLMSRLVVSQFPLYVVNSLQNGTIFIFLDPPPTVPRRFCVMLIRTRLERLKTFSQVSKGTQVAKRNQPEASGCVGEETVRQ